MAKMICMFNHKGGVSKTTTSYHLAWMLHEKGKKVLLVDADSQCNLTNIALGEEEFEQFYQDRPDCNIKSALLPAFDAKPVMLEYVDCPIVKEQEGLFLLPGSFDLSEFEVSLGVSFTLSETMGTLKNLPGSFSFLLHRTADHHDVDYIIVDMNPSLSAINQALLVSANYFIVPTAPDSFSALAIQSLAKVLPKWEKWAVRARDIFEGASYPLPKVTPRFLGTVIQRFNIRKGQPTKANKEAIGRLKESVTGVLNSALREVNMLLSESQYTDEGDCLAYIPDFQTLNTLYQKYGVPVFALSDDQLGHKGVVVKQYQENREKFQVMFSNFADRVIAMAEHA